jgi:hypothetical protein
MSTILITRHLMLSIYFPSLKALFLSHTALVTRFIKKHFFFFTFWFVEETHGRNCLDSKGLALWLPTFKPWGFSNAKGDVTRGCWRGVWEKRRDLCECRSDTKSTIDFIEFIQAYPTRSAGYEQLDTAIWNCAWDYVEVSVLLLFVVTVSAPGRLWAFLSSFQARSQNCEKRLLAASCLSLCPSALLEQLGSHRTYFDQT